MDVYLRFSFDFDRFNLAIFGFTLAFDIFSELLVPVALSFSINRTKIKLVNQRVNGRSPYSSGLNIFFRSTDFDCMAWGIFGLELETTLLA